MPRIFHFALIALLLFVGVLLLRPPFILPAQVYWLGDEEERKDRELDRLLAVVQWREQCHNRVMAALENGDISFLEAAAWFHQVNRQPADVPMPSPHVGRTPEERACQQVLSWARGRIPYAGRLEAERARELGRPDGLVLPEPPPLKGMPPCPEREE
jgi:hypothetical protein